MRIIRSKATLLAAAGVFALSCGGIAAAQAPEAAPTATDDGGEMIEIIVTAQKREQSLSDVPMSITAVTGAQLAAKGIVDVEGLVKVTPGLSYTESGAGTPVFSLRGVGYFDTTLGAKPSVAVYSDEVPLPFSIMAQGASLDLARVEVLKGPQGTLFGQNATGGAINYIAARPTSEFSAGATISFGRFSTLDTTAYVGGPIAGEAVKARLSGRVLESGDWQRSYTRDDTLGEKHFYQGRLLIDLQPSDRLKFSINVNGFKDKSDTQAAQLIDRVYSSAAGVPSIPNIVNYPLAPANDRAADWDVGQSLRRDNGFYQLALRGDLELTDELTLTSLTAYSHMSVNQLIDQDGTNQTASLTRVAGKLSSFSQELRAAGDIGPMQFVFGVNYAKEKSDERSLFQFPYTTSSFTSVPGGRRTLSSELVGTQTFDNQAAFGNVDLNLTDTVTAHGGFRITKVDLDYTSCGTGGDATSAASYSFLINFLRSRSSLPPIPPLAVGQCVTLSSTLTPGLVSGSLDEDNASWRLGLDWKPSPRTLVYANVSKGYKSGSAPTLPAFQAAQVRPVTQESVIAYEAGFKTPIISRALDASGAVFYYDYQDKQVLGRGPTILGVLPQTTNVPKSRIKGAEVQVNAYPVPGLRLSVGGTYLDSEVTDDFFNYTILSTAVITNFKGNSLPYTPKYQLVVDGDYTIPVTDTLDASLGVNVNYRSSTNAGFGGDPRLAIDPYTLVDARIGIAASDQRWSATIYGQNIFNTYYWNNVARLSDVVRRYTGMPVTYGVRVSVKY